MQFDKNHLMMVSSRQSIPLKKRLRKCQRINYLEATPERSTTVKPETLPLSIKPRVPIYRQNVTTVAKQSVKDPYELDLDTSETDERKPSKTRKNKKLDTSRKFNKTMYDVINKLEKNNKKLKKINIKNDKPSCVTKSSRANGEYEKIINNTLKKVMNKINEKKKESCFQKGNVAIAKKTHFDKVAENINPTYVKQTSKGNDSVNPSQCQYIELIDGFENEIGFLGFENSKNSSEVQTSLVSSANSSSELRSCPSQSSSVSHNDGDSNLHNDNRYSSKEYFGFNEDDNDDTVNSTVSRSMESPTFFSQRPNANSTLIREESKSPWRATLFKRKPYLLMVKNSALPNLQQEMVLDHTIVEEIEKHTSKSCSTASVQRHPVQTTMLDYIESSVDHVVEHSRDNVGHSSLFNYEEFNVEKPREKPKRRALGILQECSLGRERGSAHNVSNLTSGNHINISPNTTASDPDSRQSNFGFHTIDDVGNKENISNKEKPFRFNTAGIKMYKSGIINDGDDNSIVQEEESSIEASMDSNTDVHLFDDVDKEFEADLTLQLPKMKYQKKIRRRMERENASDNEEDDRPRKKKKDIMTKAEEAAFEKWAAEFNSMCDEVDKHHLEIE